MKDKSIEKSRGYRGFDRIFTPIKKNIKQYLCFFIALLLVQTTVLTIELCFLSSRAYAKQTIDEGYTVTTVAKINGKETEVTYVRHLRIDDLNDSQRTHFENSINQVIKIFLQLQ